MSETISELERDGVRVVRVTYSDLHGVARGKDIPIDRFAQAREGGLPHCEAVMTVDLAHNVVAGFEHGFQDIVARPDVSTLVRLPWRPEVAWCLADLEVNVTGEPHAVDPRGTVRRAAGELAGLGLEAIVGPELEFYLCEPDERSPVGYRRHVEHPSHVYTVGEVADPKGLLYEMLTASMDLGLGALAAAQEYGMSQYEINLCHSPALDAADRAFRYRTAVKDLAARHGLLATFMGKPWNDDEGSGFHLHVSLNRDGTNAFADPSSPDGLSVIARQFVAGVLDHAPALMAFHNPTVNAYKRMTVESLAPTNVNWGYDNRLAMVRIPAERGPATRVEMRVGDGAANPYLATAAVLYAGLDGLRRELEPPPDVSGNPYDLDPDRLGPALPSSLDDALAALEADDVLTAAMGPSLVATFLEIKRYELARWKAHVTEWEFREYAHHL
jgi:glutamine synthetase